MIEVISENILNAKEDIICHQVNCQGVMGAGLAKELATNWSNVKTEYIKLCRRTKPENLLGTYQLVEIGENRLVANIFGQYCYGSDRFHRYTDYAALTKAFDKLRTEHNSKSLAFPFGFGCGLANGEWNIVLDMLNTYFDGMSVQIYKFEVTT